MRTLKILGYLMTYPEAPYLEVIDQCAEILKSEKWLSKATLRNLLGALDEVRERDLLDLQEDYVDLFDRTPSLSLHLFEHVHGDSRDRGQALVDLLGVYEEAGLAIDTDEMPDYLPLFAEYAATLPPKEASENMGSIVNILSALEGRLKGRSPFHASILGAMIETASRAPDPKAVAASLQRSSGDALSFEEMDKAWEEQFAFQNTPETTGGAVCGAADGSLNRLAGSTEQGRT